MTLSGSQSNFRQQFVRIGGSLDLKSGTPISGGGSSASSSSSGGSQLPGEEYGYIRHAYSYFPDTLRIGTVYAGYNGTTWTWQVQWDAYGSWFVRIANSRGEFQQAFDIEGLFQDRIFQFVLPDPNPRWSIYNRQAPDLLQSDSAGNSSFTFRPKEGQ